jgi:hypothetical protein
MLKGRPRGLVRGVRSRAWWSPPKVVALVPHRTEETRGCSPSHAQVRENLGARRSKSPLTPSEETPRTEGSALSEGLRAEWPEAVESTRGPRTRLAAAEETSTLAAGPHPSACCSPRRMVSTAPRSVSTRPRTASTRKAGRLLVRQHMEDSAPFGVPGRRVPSDYGRISPPGLRRSPGVAAGLAADLWARRSLTTRRRAAAPSAPALW